MKVIEPGVEIINKDQIKGIEILKTIENIGRTCYKSEHLITEESAPKFVKMLISRGHEAMLEHYNISVKFTTDRGVSHEIVRHRLAAYAQESTRYCNYSLSRNDEEVKFIDIEGGIELDNSMNKLESKQIDLIINEWISACKDAEEHYMKLIELGASAQIARSVLNNSTKTEINMTANLREWRHFFMLRCDTSAHPQMREITLPLLEEMHELIPVVFDDIYEKFIGNVVNFNIKN